jgi:hypothetical protein
VDIALGRSRWKATTLRAVSSRPLNAGRCSGHLYYVTGDKAPRCSHLGAGERGLKDYLDGQLGNSSPRKTVLDADVNSNGSSSVELPRMDDSSWLARFGSCQHERYPFLAITGFDDSLSSTASGLNGRSNKANAVEPNAKFRERLMVVKVIGQAMRVAASPKETHTLFLPLK